MNEQEYYLYNFAMNVLVNTERQMAIIDRELELTKDNVNITVKIDAKKREEEKDKLVEKAAKCQSIIEKLEKKYIYGVK